MLARCSKASTQRKCFSKGKTKSKVKKRQDICTTLLEFGDSDTTPRQAFMVFDVRLLYRNAMYDVGLN